MVMETHLLPNTGTRTVVNSVGSDPVTGLLRVTLNRRDDAFAASLRVRRVRRARVRSVGGRGSGVRAP
jgi:hypothetical protein